MNQPLKEIRDVYVAWKLGATVQMNRPEFDYWSTLPPYADTVADHETQDYFLYCRVHNRGVSKYDRQIRYRIAGDDDETTD